MCGLGPIAEGGLGGMVTWAKLQIPVCPTSHSHTLSYLVLTSLVEVARLAKACDCIAPANHIEFGATVSIGSATAAASHRDMAAAGEKWFVLKEGHAPQPSPSLSTGKGKIRTACTLFRQKYLVCPFYPDLLPELKLNCETATLELPHRLPGTLRTTANVILPDMT